MEEEKLREEIRKVLHETMQQLQPVYGIGKSGVFPHSYDEDIVRLPSDIEPEEHYLVNWNGVSENNDLYGFPIEEFKKGLHVEKAKRDIFNVLDIAEIVINKLRENPHFYSDLGV